MNTICGAKCDNCPFKENCKGCAATCGRPFGASCVAAVYIQSRGAEQYRLFKRSLLEEINSLLSGLSLPAAEALHELPGSFVNLRYPLPSGESAPFLDDAKIYLGSQIEIPGRERCIGVVADTGFILICSYACGGSEPELIAYRKREV